MKTISFALTMTLGLGVAAFAGQPNATRHPIPGTFHAKNYINAADTSGKDTTEPGNLSYPNGNSTDRPSTTPESVTPGTTTPPSGTETPGNNPIDNNPVNNGTNPINNGTNTPNNGTVTPGAPGSGSGSSMPGSSTPGTGQ